VNEDKNQDKIMIKASYLAHTGGRKGGGVNESPAGTFFFNPRHSHVL
jgi:hypothetical protein